MSEQTNIPGVRVLKAVPLSPPVPKFNPPQAEVMLPGQGQLTNQLATQSMQAAQRGAATMPDSSALVSAASMVGTGYTRAQEPQGDMSARLTDIGRGLSEQWLSIQAKKKEEERAAALAAANLEAAREAEQLRLASLDIVQGEGGVIGYDSATQSWLTKHNRAGADPEVLMSLLGGISTTGREAYSTVNGRTYKTQQDIADAVRSQELAEVGFGLMTAGRGQLNSADPVTRQESMDAVFNVGVEAAKNANDVVLSARILEMTFDTIKEGASLGIEEEQQIQASIDKYNASIAGQRDLRGRFQRNEIGYNEWLEGLKLLEGEYGRETIISDDPQIAESYAREVRNARAAEVRASQSERSRDPVYIARLAEIYNTGPDYKNLVMYLASPSGVGSLANLERLAASLPPEALSGVGAAVAEAKKLREDIDSVGVLNQERLTLQTNITRISAQRAQNQSSEARAFFDSQNSKADILDSLGFAALSRDTLLTPEVYDRVESLISGIPEERLTAAEKQELINAVNLAYDSLINSAEAQYVAKQRQLDEVVNRIRAYSDTVVTPTYGIDAAGLVGGDIINKAQAAIQSMADKRLQLEQEMDEAAAQALIPTPERPFNTPPLARANIGGKNIIVPVPVSYAGSVAFTSGFRTADRPSHQGIDIGMDENTPLLAYLPATVTRVGWDGPGYGNWVEMTASDGSTHFYAHLNSVEVVQGQRVVPGQQVGLSGNTGGRSDGAHLHWEIEVDGQLVEPIAYMERFTAQASTGVRQGGSNPSNGSVVSNGSGGGSSTTPLRVGNQGLSRASADMSKDYNYGYDFLAKNIAFNTALHNMARRLNVPAMWIADIMAQESNFRHSVTHTSRNGSSGAYGLIQFVPDTVDGLLRNHPELRVEDLRGPTATPITQLKWVEAYIGEMRDLIDTPYDLAIAIFRGEGHLRRFRQDPVAYIQSSGNDADLNGTTVRGYFNKLGSGVGRAYDKPGWLQSGVEYHDRAHANCPICKNMLDNSTFMYHQYA